MISSARNPLIQRARKLARRGLRERAGEFLVEGPNAVSEAFATGHAPTVLFIAPEAGPDFAGVAETHGTQVHEVADSAMKAISGATTPPGVVGICSFVDVTADDLARRRLGLAVVSDGIRDPGNLGTMIRTALAAGADSFFISSGSADVYNPKVVRSSAGAVFRLPISRGVDVARLLAILKGSGMQVVTTAADASTSYDEVDMTVPTAFVFGNEAAGVSPEALEVSDVAASLPMAGGAESLNVAISAAVVLFEAGRQRRHA